MQPVNVTVFAFVCADGAGTAFWMPGGAAASAGGVLAGDGFPCALRTAVVAKPATTSAPNLDLVINNLLVERSAEVQQRRDQHHNAHTAV